MNPYGSLLALPDPLPDWAPAFVKATHKAWEAYIQSPEAANKAILEANDQLTEELMGCILEAQNPYLAGSEGLRVMTKSDGTPSMTSLFCLSSCLRAVLQTVHGQLPY